MIVKELRKTKGEGPTKAFADIELNDGIVLKGFSLMETRGELWLGVPQEKYQDRDGNTKYQKKAYIPEKILNEMKHLVIEAFEGKQESSEDECPF